MYKSDINSWGRSMIEMLGVLAIVGVLSVGGIVGFSKAMITYQMTNAATEYAGFIRDLIQFREALLKAVKEKGQSGINVGLTDVIAKIGIMPKNWAYRSGRIVIVLCILQRLLQMVLHLPLIMSLKITIQLRGKVMSESIVDCCLLM